MLSDKPTKPRIRFLDIKLITEDHDCQGRVRTNMEYVREFSEALLDGATFPPVAVFYDGNRYYLADGFHRVAAHRQACRVEPALRNVRAEIHDGSKRDAVLYAASANKEWSIKRTIEDIKRAITLVLDDEEGFHWSDARISKHVWARPELVSKTRKEFCERKGIEEPSVYTRSDDQQFVRPRRRPTQAPQSTNRPAPAAPNAQLQPQHQYPTQQTTSESPNQIKQPRSASEAAQWLQRRGFTFRGFRDPIHYPGIRGFYGHGCVYEVCEMTSDTEIHHEIGNIALFHTLIEEKELMEEGSRMILICREEDGPTHAIDLAKRLGIEFMTVDEFAESLKRSHTDTDAGTGNNGDGRDHVQETGATL